MIYLYFAAFIVAFAILFKSASYLVDGASSIARILNVPKLVIGIVLVGLGTTAPEFGHPKPAAESISSRQRGDRLNLS